jgi:hypothetical protein
VHVQPVESPAEPRGDAGFPLLAGDALVHGCGLKWNRRGETSIDFPYFRHKMKA